MLVVELLELDDVNSHRPLHSLASYLLEGIVLRSMLFEVCLDDEIAELERVDLDRGCQLHREH